MKTKARALDEWLNCVQPKWPKTSFKAPDPKLKVFLRFDSFIGFCEN